MVDNAAQLGKDRAVDRDLCFDSQRVNRSFGMTPTMTNRTIRKSLAALGIELGIGADQINRNFVDSPSRLRVYGDRAIEVYSANYRFKPEKPVSSFNT